MLNPDETRSGIAKRLKVARENAGLSQGQVAKMLNCHRPTISEIEAGRRRVSADELVKFCEIYDVSIAWMSSANPDVPNPAVELAARELTKLKDEDFEKIIQLLQTLKKAQTDPK